MAKFTGVCSNCATVPTTARRSLSTEHFPDVSCSAVRMAPDVCCLSGFIIKDGIRSKLGRISHSFDGDKIIEARRHRCRCLLKKPRWSTFPEPSTMAPLLFISWFQDVEPQQLLLIILLLNLTSSFV